MSSVAEVKFKAQSGSDILTILQQIKATTRDVGSENAKILREIREQAKAEAEAAQGARDKAEAQRKATAEARAAAKVMRDQLAAAKEVERMISKTAGAAKQVAEAALDAYQNMEKLAGVRAFADTNKDLDEIEEKIVRFGQSMDKTKAQMEALTGARGKLLFEIAGESGFKASDITDALTSVQNETSMGERFLSRGGAVMKSVSKFANVTGASVTDAAVAAAQYADKFQLTDDQLIAFMGGLYKQQTQGSLEAKTMPKFISAAVPYMALSGKKGNEGALEMMAIANIIKDEGGTGKGQYGAATARTLMMAMFNTLSDTKKRGMLEKGLGTKVMGADGRVDFAALTETLAALLKSDPAKFNRVMADSVHDSSARKALVAIAAGGVKNKGTDKDIKALRAPDTKAGAAAIESGIRDLGQTTNVGKIIEENKQLVTAAETHEDVRPALAETHRAGGRFRVLHPRMSAFLGEGRILSAMAAATQYGDQAANYIATKFHGRPTDELGGAMYDRDNLLKRIDELDKDKSPARRDDLIENMRRELTLVLSDIKDLEAQRKQSPGQGVVVNNNITIAPNANVEARVTQEAQQSSDRAKAGATPQPRAAGVR